ncbi:glycoside hydrolase, partial [Pseudomonas pergaminensis]
QWLVEQGRYEPLADKLVQTPDAAKLLGASHVYLWGNDLLGPGDVQDWPRLLKVLQGDRAWRDLLDGEARQTLQ